jgi:hypothetical protein
VRDVLHPLLCPIQGGQYRFQLQFLVICQTIWYCLHTTFVMFNLQSECWEVVSCLCLVFQLPFWSLNANHCALNFKLCRQFCGLWSTIFLVTPHVFFTIQNYFMPCIYLCMGNYFTGFNMCEHVVSFCHCRCQIRLNFYVSVFFVTSLMHFHAMAINDIWPKLT